MKWMLLAVFVAGCGSQGLAVDGTCRYTLDGPTSSSGVSQRCTMFDDGALSMRFEDILSMQVADAASQGTARMEQPGSLRASLGYAGERFGLTSVNYKDQGTDWGGHVTWNVEPNEWHVEAVGTSTDGFTFAAWFDSP